MGLAGATMKCLFPKCADGCKGHERRNYCPTCKGTAFLPAEIPCWNCGGTGKKPLPVFSIPHYSPGAGFYLERDLR